MPPASLVPALAYGLVPLVGTGYGFEAIAVLSRPSRRLPREKAASRYRGKTPISVVDEARIAPGHRFRMDGAGMNNDSPPATDS